MTILYLYNVQDKFWMPKKNSKSAHIHTYDKLTSIILSTLIHNGRRHKPMARSSSIRISTCARISDRQGTLSLTRAEYLRPLGSEGGAYTHIWVRWAVDTDDYLPPTTTSLYSVIFLIYSCSASSCLPTSSGQWLGCLSAAGDRRQRGAILENKYSGTGHGARCSCTGRRRLRRRLRRSARLYDHGGGDDGNGNNNNITGKIRETHPGRNA